MNTETLTRYVARGANGRVLFVTNELGAKQLGGSAETLSVPAEGDVRAILAGILGSDIARRCDDILTWSVSTNSNVSGDRNSWSCADRIRRATGWRVSVSPSGASVFVWPAL